MQDISAGKPVGGFMTTVMALKNQSPTSAINALLSAKLLWSVIQKLPTHFPSSHKMPV